MAIALGPAPVVYQSTSEMINIISSQSDRATVKPCDPVKYFEACLDNGHCDLLESEESIHDDTDAMWDDFNRDIEWM